MTQQKKDRLLTPREVAERFAVDPKTVTRWALAGKILSIKTPGGHRRYPESHIAPLLVAQFDTPAAK